MSHHIIQIHRDAPPKPPLHAPCNGCGACCALEPCPMGVVVSLRRKGACKALQWQRDERRYECGLVASPAQHWPWLLRGLAPMLAWLAYRGIAAGKGCDADIEVGAE